MHTFGAILVEMEVDDAIGVARIRRCTAGYSAGRILNPRTARSQMIGGIIGATAARFWRRASWTRASDATSQKTCPA